MSAVRALTRATWFQARSYRLSLIWQVVSILVSVVPIYFIAGALQPTMAGSIAAESHQYFSFVLAGTVCLAFVSASIATLPGAIAGGISSGYFEALLMTRAPLSSIFAGLSSYSLLLTAVRAGVMLLGGWVMGASLAWSQAGPALLILVLLVVAHWGIGLVASALIIAFRSYGPLISIFIGLSMLFGGVYYPVTAIPSWLKAFALLTPLSYGLKAFRRVLLQGYGLSDVGPDVMILAAMSVLALAVGAMAIDMALRYARKSGSLGLY